MNPEDKWLFRSFQPDTALLERKEKGKSDYYNRFSLSVDQRMELSNFLHKDLTALGDYLAIGEGRKA